MEGGHHEELNSRERCGDASVRCCNEEREREIGEGER